MQNDTPVYPRSDPSTPGSTPALRSEGTPALRSEGTPALRTKPLGQLLIEKGVIQSDQLERALEEQRRNNHQKLLGEVLVELHLCTEDQITESLAAAYGVPYARISPRVADPKVISVLPRDFL
jgi:hypothetical protein